LPVISFAGDFRAFKAQIAAQYNGVKLTAKNIELGKDNVKPEYLAKSPAGRVPLLETADGAIFESNAIARYVAKIRRDTELAGRTFFETAQVDAWMDFCSHEVELPVTMWVYPILGLATKDAATEAKASAELFKALATLDKHLLLRTYVVGESITLADICLVAALYYPFKFVLDEKARSSYPNVVRWYFTCANQKEFKTVLGEVAFADTVATSATPGTTKKEEPKKEKAAAPAPAPKPKEDKKKKDEDDDGAPEDDVPKEPKKPDVFASLPPTPLVLDEWKRTYSNSRSVNYYPSMEWFWQNLDRAGYSLWKCEYKYNDENKVDWQTSNLIGGFIQRCDEVRKYAFGSMVVAGTQAPYLVSGIWLIRGLDIQPLIAANDDASCYNWTKLDPENLQTRKEVADYWCATENLTDGSVIYDSKIFK